MARDSTEVASDVVLRCDGLTRRFGDRVAVDDVGFVIAAGETYGLLGPNGAGKTTTIRMLCGLLRRDGGSVILCGEPLDHTAIEVKRHIGYVPQEIALYPDLTAQENLAFFAKIYGLRGAELSSRVSEVLELIALTDRRDDRVDSFSGGMQRRLNIGVGLLHRPSLLVLDEPTVGVDPQSRNAILASVETLGGTGLAVLYTTHYMEEAERLCDRIGVIDGGRLIAEGTRRELVALVGDHARIDLGATGDVDRLQQACAAIPGVADASATGDGLQLLVDDGPRQLPRIIEAAEAVGAVITSVEVAEPDLEAVFLHLTGTALRE
jgi:ABC-2 type transport system ATP-binding protein